MQPGRGTFHRSELTRWARAVGLLDEAPAATDGDSDGENLTQRMKREAVLRAFVEGKKPSDLPAKVLGFHDALRAAAPSLFEISNETFSKFWKVQKLYKLSK